MARQHREGEGKGELCGGDHWVKKGLRFTFFADHSAIDLAEKAASIDDFGPRVPSVVKGVRLFQRFLVFRCKAALDLPDVLFRWQVFGANAASEQRLANRLVVRDMLL